MLPPDGSFPRRLAKNLYELEVRFPRASQRFHIKRIAAPEFVFRDCGEKLRFNQLGGCREESS